MPTQTQPSDGLTEPIAKNLQRADEVWSDLSDLQEQAANVKTEEGKETPAFLFLRIKAQSDLLDGKRRLLVDIARMTGTVAAGPEDLVTLLDKAMDEASDQGAD